MPSAAIHPAAYWAATGSVFSGTIVCAVGVSKLGGWLIRTIKRWRSPHSADVIAHGGNFAAIELTHYGEPATWEVRIRIRRAVADLMNPDPLARLCFLRKDGKAYRSLLLKHGESAHVTVANVETSEWGHGSWLALRDAESRYGTRIPDSGVIIEAEIKAEPSMKEGIIKRCFQLSRFTGHGGAVEFTDVACS